MYTYQIDGNVKILQPKAKSLRSCTIKNGSVGDFKKNEYYKGTLEDICKKVHDRKAQIYNNNYLELYNDPLDTNKLINIL